MSITAAIVVGGGLGIAASKFLFNYTKNEYDQKIAELDLLITKLNSHLETLISLRNQIPGFWEDENAQNTAATLDVTIEKVRSNMATAESLSNTFKLTVNSLDGSRDVLTGFVQDALGALTSLGQ